MKLHKPFMISSRLHAAIEIGGAVISMEISDITDEGRLVYHYFIDHPDFNYENADLKSGVGNGSLQEGFASLLAFLASDAGKYQYSKSDENEYSFDSPSVVEWAYQNSDEIGMLQMEIEETPNLICD